MVLSIVSTSMGMHSLKEKYVLCLVERKKDISATANGWRPPLRHIVVAILGLLKRVYPYAHKNKSSPKDS